MTTRARKRKVYKIPFRHEPGVSGLTEPRVALMEYVAVPEGRLREAAAHHHLYAPDEWRDNDPFTSLIRICGTYRGHSSARVSVVNVSNFERYSFGLAGFFEAINTFGATPLEGGALIEGSWVFRKQGSNYSLWPVTR